MKKDKAAEYKECEHVYGWCYYEDLIKEVDYIFSDPDIEIKFNFCPMCGIKLKK